MTQTWRTSALLIYILLNSRVKSEKYPQVINKNIKIKKKPLKTESLQITSLTNLHLNNNETIFAFTLLMSSLILILARNRIFANLPPRGIFRLWERTPSRHLCCFACKAITPSQAARARLWGAECIAPRVKTSDLAVCACVVEEGVGR